MAYRYDITEDHRWFIGEDKFLDFEILEDDGKPIDDVTKLPLDMTGKSLVWSFKSSVFGADPGIIEKRTGGGGVNVIGIYNATRANNTQLVRVTIHDEDTDTLRPTSEKLSYYHSLKELTDNAETILTFGSAVLQKSTAPPV